MKRTVSLLLILSALLTVTSCGDTAVTPKTGDTAVLNETTVPVLTDNLPDVDMGGYEMSIFIPSKDTQAWALIALDADEITGDIVYDEMYSRNRRIEERFHCKITALEQNAITVTTLVNSVLAGDNEYKIAQLNDENVNNANTAGILTSFDRLPYVNLEAEWWNQWANRSFMLNGKQYAAAGDYSLSEYSKAYMIYINKDIYSEITQEKTVYDYVLDGTWTLDRLVTIAKQYARDLNGDTVMDNNDRWGFSGCAKVSMGMLMSGFGISLVSTDSDGNPYYALPGNESAINKLEKMVSVFQNSGSWYYNAPDPMGGMQDENFKNGNVLFQAASIWQTDGYRSLEFDIGFLPTPKYDESQKEYYSIVAGGTLTTIPKSLSEEDLKNVSIILEAMAFDSHNTLVPLYKETVLKGKYARDEHSIEMIDVIMDSAYFDTGIIIWQNARRALMTGPLSKFDGTLVSTIDSVKNSMEEVIQKAIDSTAQ